jgi:hypothetical protein
MFKLKSALQPWKPVTVVNEIMLCLRYLSINGMLDPVSIVFGLHTKLHYQGTVNHPFLFQRYYRTCQENVNRSLIENLEVTPIAVQAFLFYLKLYLPHPQVI